MDEKQDIIQEALATTLTAVPQTMPESSEVSSVKSAAREGRRGSERSRNPRRQGRRSERPKSAYDQRIISIRRVARVMAGGRRFSFSVALVAGDRKGSVAVGIGKGADTALAINKALNNAKKQMRKISLTKDMRPAHDVSAKYAASRVMLMPSPGRGLTAGSSVRHVLELAGIRDVSAKILSRSKNQLNNARAAMKALAQLR